MEVACQLSSPAEVIVVVPFCELMLMSPLAEAMLLVMLGSGVKKSALTADFSQNAFRSKRSDATQRQARVRL